ncbi:MAG: DUF3570 domain-containing protein [Ferruginibacter sp.]
MKKICLVLVGIYLNLLSGFAQSTASFDSTQYKNRTLQLEEVNLVSSYYRQDGNNSSVTGGIGSEKLTDFANIIDVKFAKYDKRFRKHSFTLEGGIDSYTSASSDQIDSKANSSASSQDIRIYPSLSWTVENEKAGTTFGLNASASTEFDYKSFGFGASFSKKSKNNNREFSIKAQAYLDKVSLIFPVELRTGTIVNVRDESNYATTPRNSFSGSISYTTVVNQKLQLMFLLDLTWQNGYLGLPFHRVYFNDNALKAESLPSNRFKIPVGVRANYFLGDKVVIRSFYRFYHDDWALTAHTADIETAIKVTPFFSIVPFYRYYHQSAVKYFAPYQAHSSADIYYTSNYDLSKFDSHFMGAGFRMAPPKGVLGNEHFSMLEIRYGHYTRNTTNFSSNIVSLNLKFK